MGMLRMLSRQGDTQITWDSAAVRSGDPAAMAAIEAAERIFAAERERGATAFVVRGAGAPPVRIEQLDREAEEIILVPSIIGG
ncbi:MAG: hypothetical protein ACHQ4H_12520 [Ktedonobacterales bacterium]